MNLEFPAKAQEILICRNFREGLVEGVSVIVRAEAEHEAKYYLFIRIGVGRWRKMAEGIASASGLPVRYVTRRRSTNAIMQEAPWPTSQKTSALKIVAVIAGLAPFVGGVTVGYLSPRPAIIVAIGAALWICPMLALYAASHGEPVRKKSSMIYPITTIFTFSASYAFAVVVTAFIVHSH